MKVDHFSTRVAGGAGSGARRLHESLLAAGVDSRFWYWRRGSPVPEAAGRIVLWGRGPTPVRAMRRLFGRIRRARIKSRLARQRRGAPEGLELFTPPEVGWATPFDPSRFRGDLVHLHWIAGLIDWPTFFDTLPRDHPVVWTLRDMNPFTGGCHFSGGCQGFTNGCGYCPQLGRPAPNDLSRIYADLKTTVLEGVNLHVVAPSKWILEHARRSRAFRDARSFHHIPTGIETDVFRPIDPGEARSALGLDRDALVVGLGSASLDNPRKGFRLACEALSSLRVEGGLTLLCFGADPPTEAVPGNVRLHSTGYLDDPRVQARVYSAADCFLLPSLEDNLPKTGLEALACGTPVVGFDAGGIPDFVLPGVTGALATAGDTGELAARITQMLADRSARRRMGIRGRRLVQERFTARGQADAYAALYGSLVGTDTAA